MKFGAHVSIAGGLPNAIDRALEIGAECIQIFISSPRQWRMQEHSDAQLADYLAKLRASGIGPVFIHTSYLLNLASPDETLWQRSLESFSATLFWAERIESQGIITHLGSGTGTTEEDAEERLAFAIRLALQHVPGKSLILLETSAGGTLGSSFPQLRRILDRVDGDKRIAVCLDTAHVFAAGYDLCSDEGLAHMLEEFDANLGMDRLLAIHANDSKSALGSARDRHENIGQGRIGADGFRRVLRAQQLSELPFILEVPGMDGHGPDRENLEILRRLAGP